MINKIVNWLTTCVDESVLKRNSGWGGERKSCKHNFERIIKKWFYQFSHHKTFNRNIFTNRYIWSPRLTLKLKDLKKNVEQTTPERKEQWIWEESKYNPGKVVILESHFPTLKEKPKNNIKIQIMIFYNKFLYQNYIGNILVLVEYGIFHPNVTF